MVLPATAWGSGAPAGDNFPRKEFFMSGKSICARFLILMSLVILFIPYARPQQKPKVDRELALLMLNNVARDVRRH
jgi:hypothetical protein